MIGVVDVGGGLRDVYGAGVFDFCMGNAINFDFCVGVSAGAANIISYIANQPGRNYRFYTEYTFRDEYMGARNLIKNGSFIGYDYIYGTLSNSDGEDPIDYDTFAKSDKRALFVATEVETGAPIYFTNDDISQDNYRVIMASGCLPLIERPCDIDGNGYYDGGISDPIPFKKAFDAGCDKVVVILTRPRDYYRDSKDDEISAKLLERHCPEVAKRVMRRADLYNFQMDQVKELEKDGKALILAPKDIEGMTTLKRDRDAMEKLYSYGVSDAEKIRDFI